MTCLSRALMASVTWRHRRVRVRGFRPTLNSGSKLVVALQLQMSNMLSKRIPILSRTANYSIRAYSFKASEQPRIRIGSVAPNFQAKTSDGQIDFHQFIGNSWTILFSHPADFTPVCTTELGAFAALKDEFTKRNTKLIGLSADKLESHHEWAKDIEEVSTGGKKFDFPIIADEKRDVAFLYDMVDEEGFKKLDSATALTIRNVFIIDPSKKVRLFMTYPASTGRNTAEVLRVLDALQLTDSQNVATPVNWVPGKDVIVPLSVSTEDAKKKWGNVNVVKPYLRYVNPLSQSSVAMNFARDNNNRWAYTALGVGLGLGLMLGINYDQRDQAVQELNKVLEK